MCVHVCVFNVCLCSNENTYLKKGIADGRNSNSNPCGVEQATKRGSSQSALQAERWCYSGTSSILAHRVPSPVLHSGDQWSTVNGIL